MERLRRCALFAAFVLAALAAPAARAAAPPVDSTFTRGCAPYGDERICSAQVPSFDGALLDADLTESLRSGPGQRHPLIVLLHGFGNDKHEWESLSDEGDGADKHRWNSHWFAAHGYYVLTATARGFRTDEAPPGQPGTPAGSSESAPNGTIHLKSREFEVRDTQWLAALAAAARPDIDPTQVAVSGGSYGGGESWLQAARPEWTFPRDCTTAGADLGDPALTAACADDKRPTPLPALSLQVAVPKYPWTDLAYALAPHGRPGGPGKDDPYESSQAGERNPTGLGENPFGVLKASFVSGFFALGTKDGAFEAGTTTPTYEEGPIDVPAWNARAVAGEPYLASDPVVAQLARGLTEFRGAYYQDRGWDAQVGRREVAIYSIQGWTDDLFEAVESFRMFKALKRRDPLWPVAVGLGDVGHSRAQNPPATWQRLNAQAFAFLQSQIGGSHRQQTTVSSEPTTCEGPSTPARRLTGSTPERLAHGTLTVAFDRGGALTDASGTADPNGPATDPVTGGIIAAGEPCRAAASPSADDAYTAVSDPLRNERTYVGLGEVRVPYRLTGGWAQLDARVWDVQPDGDRALLVTRGVRRLEAGYDPPSGTLRLPLFGNHWRLAPGHRLRLDLTETDAPFLRPGNPGNAIAFDPPTLVLPTREATAGTLAGH